MFSSTEDNVSKENESESDIENWLIRRCELYSEEYKDCRSLAARFHQYFVYGKTIDCTQWKRDCDNCFKWTENGDMKAARELIESEKARRLSRLRPHYTNDVWEKRSSPPTDWNKPLPEYMQKEFEATYLNIKAKEMNGEISETSEQSSFCSLM